MLRLLDDKQHLSDPEVKDCFVKFDKVKNLFLQHAFTQEVICVSTRIILWNMRKNHIVEHKGNPGKAFGGPWNKNPVVDIKNRNVNVSVRYELKYENFLW